MNSNGISNEDRPTLLSFLRGGDCQGYAPQSGEFIGHCHDQEKAQVHQDAVETDRKELDESCRLRTNVKQLYETIMRGQRDVQRNNESLANAAIVFITQESLDAFTLLIEQLSQFYNTSAKVIVEMIQYALDSTYKVAQEEWTRIEGMIHSEFE